MPPRSSPATAPSASAVLDAVFAHAPLGLAVWDAQLRFVRVNHQLAAMNGVAPEAWRW